jgi:hypothetical protein
MRSSRHSGRQQNVPTGRKMSDRADDKIADHHGGSARGYQEFFAQWATPTSAAGQPTRPHFIHRKRPA